MGTKWKPLKVLIVGDKPSSKNVDPSVPFVGTKSYKRLLSWIAELDLDISKVTLKNHGLDVLTLRHEHSHIIILGKSIKYKYIQTIISYSYGKYMVIDHPSPRNRNFNDPAYEKQMLKKVKRWLYE